MAYAVEEKARARSLFVEQQWTLEEVAAETGISKTQLANWGKEGKWTEERAEFERDYLELAGNVHKLKVATVKKALTSQHSQDIIAATNMLKLMPVGRKQRDGVDRAALFIEWLTELIEYLKARDGEALRHLQPHLAKFAAKMKEADKEAA